MSDEIDQDAMAAEWEAAAAGEQPDFDSLGDDGDDLASEWEAMVDGDGETFLPQHQSSGPERILNQEEIDSLGALDAVSEATIRLLLRSRHKLISP